jgi:hypothetical protein
VVDRRVALAGAKLALDHAGMSDEHDSFANTVVQHSIANSEMDETKVYLEAGRRHQQLPSEALEALFIEAFRAWALAASNDTSVDHKALDDLRAEYRLRNAEPCGHFCIRGKDHAQLSDKIVEYPRYDEYRALRPPYRL